VSSPFSRHTLFLPVISHHPSLVPPTRPAMPTCRRKRVVLTEPSEALLQLAKTDPNKEVYYMQQTGEIFETYEYDTPFLFLGSYLELTGRVLRRAYAARMSFYRLRQFQCEVTGKSGLDYFQAIESELLEARTMHSRFPEQLKSAVLKAVQWRECLNCFGTMRVHVYGCSTPCCRGYGAFGSSCRSGV
jgi:hypothetical protein